MDGDYPRNISQGFADMPDDIDAAFAVQAPSHRGKEKAYFFKGTHTSLQYSAVVYNAYVSWSFKMKQLDSHMHQTACACFCFQGTCFICMSSSTNLPMRSVSTWPGPPHLCSSCITQTSSAISHGTTSSVRSLQIPVRLLCFCLPIFILLMLIL